MLGWWLGCCFFLWPHHGLDVFESKTRTPVILKLIFFCWEYFSEIYFCLSCSIDSRILVLPNTQASPAFNDYTPLIFLASTPPSANGHQVAQAMELLITSRADVHRECGQMHTGRLVPLRFAARAQNEYGLATGINLFALLSVSCCFVENIFAPNGTPKLNF